MAGDVDDYNRRYDRAALPWNRGNMGIGGDVALSSPQSWQRLALNQGTTPLVVLTGGNPMKSDELVATILAALVLGFVAVVCWHPLLTALMIVVV